MKAVDIALNKTFTYEKLQNIVRGKVKAKPEDAVALAREILWLRQRLNPARSELISELISMAGQHSVTVLADKFKMSEAAIWNIGNAHGVSFAYIKRRWSPDDDAYYIAAKNNGVSNRQIAEYFGVTLNAAKIRGNYLRKKGLL